MFNTILQFWSSTGCIASAQISNFIVTNLSTVQHTTSDTCFWTPAGLCTSIHKEQLIDNFRSCGMIYCTTTTTTTTAATTRMVRQAGGQKTCALPGLELQGLNAQRILCKWNERHQGEKFDERVREDLETTTTTQQTNLDGEGRRR